MNTVTPRRQISLLRLQQIVQNLVAVAPDTQGVWVKAELSDVAERGGHCYLELIEKGANGAVVAKARAVIWANMWPRLNDKFQQATGRRFASGLNVAVKVSANYHPVYGMSLVISDVDPSATLGELELRRREILMRLKTNGTLEMNRQLDFPEPTLRVAVVSAPGAAGFGDFINQLYHSNSLHLRFTTRLFPAVMQGEKAPRSVMDALLTIADEQERWDCVVIIRGGGATSELSCFDHYELAEYVAQFPLPVIVGIGHERDVTVLDYVAKARVKTPTAAAELLTDMAVAQLERLRTVASAILQLSTECVSGANRYLAYVEGQLPVLPLAALQRASQRLTGSMVALGSLGPRLIQPMQSRLDRMAHAMDSARAMTMQRRMSRLDSLSELLAALSPEATLRRGYSITRAAGRVVTDASLLPPGTEIETTLHSGTLHSVITHKSN